MQDDNTRVDIVEVDEANRRYGSVRDYAMTFDNTYTMHDTV